MKVPCEKRPRETSSEAVPYVSIGPGPTQMKTTFLVKGRVVVNPRVERGNQDQSVEMANSEPVTVRMRLSVTPRQSRGRSQMNFLLNLSLRCGIGLFLWKTYYLAFLIVTFSTSELGMIRNCVICAQK